MNTKFDFKKENKNLYSSKQKPALVDIPPFKFIMIDGKGKPKGENYQNAMQILYSITYTIKMSKKNLLKCLISIPEDDYAPRYHFFLLLKS